jgi:arsenate reductase (glutaredoxin)
VSVRLYGFRGCDAVRKAMAWLDANAVPCDFFDYRRETLDASVVDDWFARAGWERVFNRNSTTFRELPERDKAGIDAARAKAMILAETNLIKRPVLDTGDTLLFGFKAPEWAAALAHPSASRSHPRGAPR